MPGTRGTPPVARQQAGGLVWEQCVTRGMRCAAGRRQGREHSQLPTQLGTPWRGRLCHHCCSTSQPLDPVRRALLQPELKPGTPCFVTGKPAKNFALWGRSY